MKKGRQNQMNQKERFKQEIRPYVEERLVRDVFDTKEFTITCAANSAYCIYFHDEVEPKTNLTWGFYLKGNEFATFMEEPTMQNFKWLNLACQKRKENRAVLFTPELAQKFRALKKQLDLQGKTEVDLALEKRLVEAAGRK